MQTFEQTVMELRGLSSAVVCSHVSPDPDALGSSGALQLAMQDAGVAARFFLPDPAPDNMSGLLKGVEIIETIPRVPVDALVVLDTASERRINGPAAELKIVSRKVINIDHHSSNSGWGDVNYVRADAASTATIVHELLTALGWSISPKAADLLLAGLMDDTGSFRFSNADQASFEAAAALAGLGASPQRIANELYFSLPERVLRLQARALNALEITNSGSIAVIAVSNAMLEECGARAEDTEGLVDLARSVQGTAAAAFFRELEDGWKVSLRSKREDLDVNAIAAQFGGGGHRAAAGCRIGGTLIDARAQIVSVLKRALDELP